MAAGKWYTLWRKQQGAGGGGGGQGRRRQLEELPAAGRVLPQLPAPSLAPSAHRILTTTLEGECYNSFRFADEKTEAQADPGPSWICTGPSGSVYARSPHGTWDGVAGGLESAYAENRPRPCTRGPHSTRRASREGLCLVSCPAVTPGTLLTRGPAFSSCAAPHAHAVSPPPRSQGLRQTASPAAHQPWPTESGCAVSHLPHWTPGREADGSPPCPLQSPARTGPARSRDWRAPAGSASGGGTE